MPRPRKASDEEILDGALALMQEHGSDALTFASLAAHVGLSGAALVQRFGTKQRLIQAAVARGWAGLEHQTRELANAAPKTPAGAVGILSALSREYGDIDSYADKLHLLREDLRSPEFRARGHAWVSELAPLLEACFPETPALPPDFGMLMVAQWQGALLLWAFAPRVPLESFVRAHLERYLKAQDRWAPKPSKKPRR